MDGSRRQKRRGEGRPSGPVIVQTPAGSVAVDESNECRLQQGGVGPLFCFFLFFSIRT